MHVLSIGPSGMVGQAALAACFRDPGVERVTTLVRSPHRYPGRQSTRGGLCRSVSDHVRARDISTPPMHASSVRAPRLGAKARQRIAVSRMSSPSLSLAHWCSSRLQCISCMYRVTEPTAQGKGARCGRGSKARPKTAYSVLALRAWRCFALAIQPLDGVCSTVGWYRLFYAVLRPLYPLLRRISASHVTDSDTLGRAMLRAMKPGVPRTTYDSAAIQRIGNAL